jgi:hypothetical protein
MTPACSTVIWWLAHLFIKPKFVEGRKELQGEILPTHTGLRSYYLF